MARKPDPEKSSERIKSKADKIEKDDKNTDRAGKGKETNDAALDALLQWGKDVRKNDGS